ncbi:CD3324 family protein [Fusibacter sp. JL216-2]|uniref:CD3324 family protein n=1 Tax=Fusibacter sp. JL216-2 TaxID=3071453 RepID=UPI003D35540D
MSYKSADKVLPKELMKEIQKYIQGEYIYIPNTTSSKKGWGVKSGIREELTSRNNKIRKEYSEDCDIDSLSEKYYLSVNTIKKIIYSKK